jgi:hypothetical protein
MLKGEVISAAPVVKAGDSTIFKSTPSSQEVRDKPVNKKVANMKNRVVQVNRINF